MNGTEYIEIGEKFILIDGVLYDRDGNKVEINEKEQEDPEKEEE